MRFSRYFLVVFCFFAFILNAQNKKLADSLRQELNKKNPDTTAIKLYNKLSWAINTDDPDEARKYSQMAITLSKKNDYKKGLAEAYNKYGIFEKSTGNYDNALKYYDSSKFISTQLKDTVALSNLYNNYGNVYKSQGNYAKALDCQFQGLKLNEQLKNKEGTADGLLNVALIYDDLKNNKLALDYLNQSLKMAQDLNDKKRCARALINIGNIYADGNKDEKMLALNYYNQVLKIHTESGDKKGQSMSLNNIGAVYYDLGQWEKAEEYYNKSLLIKEEIGDKKGKAVIYENFAYIQQEKKDYKKAAQYFNKAVALADTIGDAGLKISLLKSIAENYFIMKDYKAAAETHAQLFNLNDSIFNSEMTAQLSEMQTKYETEKKDKEILGLQKDREIQEKEMGRKKTVINAIIGISGLILVLLIVSIFSYRNIRKANVKLALQNDEILQQKSEIEHQRDDIQQQKEIIEEHQKEIKDSINYAKRIQQAVMPSEAFFQNCLKELHAEANDNTGVFVLFKPKDIVSGDFYWATKVNEWLVFTVADCTGHGVPGSFMSMLGISFLNEIIRKKEVTKASEVLDHLRISIIDALKQKGEAGEQKDGMDVSICCINTRTMEMHVAAANNPVWLIKNNETELTEIKPDKMPVAIHTNMPPFTNHTLQIQKGDTIYLASDGYQDQFGGQNGKKFLTKNLKSLIVQNSKLPMDTQKKLLNEAIENWRSASGIINEQTDDITIMGIRI